MRLSPVAASSQQRSRFSVFSRGAFALAIGIFWTHSASAQDNRFPWEDFDKRLKASQSVGALTSDLFGDRVALQNGALSFEVTDVSVPGNSSLPVAFTRRYEVINHKDHNGADGMLGDWNVVVPSISGSFAPDWESNGSVPGNRCSDRLPPPLPDGDVSWNEFWHGIHIEIPGVGGGELLAYDPAVNPKTVVPNNGAAYKWVTNDHIRVYCLPETAPESVNDNHTGENFVAIAPNGTKYWFTHMAQYFEPTLETLLITPYQTYNNLHPRRKNVLYATRVEDRFGNWVTYTYSNAETAPGKLTGIQSSDGRALTISYLNGVVTSVSGAGRRWDYSYATTSGGRKSLDRVTLPDGSYWTYDFEVLTDAEIGSLGWGESDRTCLHLETPSNLNFQPSGSVTHPSGATGTFTMFIQEHGRTNVPVSCGHVTAPSNNPVDDVNTAVISSYSFTLKQKRVHHPSLIDAVWNYSYPGTRRSTFFPDIEGSMTNPICNDGAACHRPDPDCAPACPGSTTTVVTGPNQEWTRYTFGNSYLYNEGKLLRVERGSVDALGAVTVLETTANTYDFSQVDKSYLPTSSQPEQVYPASYGDSLAPNHDGFATEFHRPQIATVTTRQGVNFVWEANEDCGPTFNLLCFDAFARATDVNRFSTLPGSPIRNEVTEYHDELDDWVVGQVEKLTVNGIEVSQTTFDSRGLPVTLESFGKLQHTLGYDTTSTIASGQLGTLKTYLDGRSNLTTVSSWHRGVPRTIDYPGTAMVTATVNDDGTIASVTDENSYTTRYDYDEMGRLTLIDYPDGDTPDWISTTLGFDNNTTAAFGLPAGHWRQRVQTGNGVRETHFDALWQPRVVDEYEVGGTHRYTRFTYDHAGRTTFAAYPSASSAEARGIETFYDALGRVIRVEQDAEDRNNDGVANEADELKTYTAYLAGFQTRVTNPRTYATTTSYMAFDQPATDWPTLIMHPENTVTEIVRDVFGKPEAITRRDTGGTLALTRTYDYNGHQELCRTAEPETGVTILHYDAAGNLDWSASGLGDIPCDGSVPAGVKVTRQYDARNRLTHLTFPDGNGSQVWSYTPDGLPASVTTYNYEGLEQTSATNSYTYNKRRLLTSETLHQPDPGYSWSLAYRYTPEGHLEGHTYPGGLTVAYAPNALGQPTQAGTFATGVSYFPNGAVAQFTYGNGIVHTMEPNERQLPEHSLASYGTTEFLDDYYDYDANGNVAAITDDRDGAGNRGNRDMTYDGLDRLWTATSTMFGGAATYTYDVLDNLRTVVAPGRSHQYQYTDNTNRLTSITDTVSGATVLALGYDPQGNLATKDGGGQMFDFDFDFGNRLRAAEGKETYRYDAHGRRIQATSPAGVIRSFYGQDGVLRFQSDDRKDETVSYVYLAGSLVAEHVEPIVSTVPTAAPTINQPTATPVTSSNFTVAWTSVADASTYQLEQRIGAGAWQVPPVHNGTGTSSQVTVSTSGTYGYRVRGCSGGGCGPWSAIKTITVDLIVPATPVLIVPELGLNGSYTVGWSSEADATEYVLQESPDGSTGWAAVYQDGVALSTSFTAKAAGTYHYRVRACNGDAACSAWSPTGNVQVIYPPPGCTLTAPELSTSGDYTVSCSTVAGASSYQLDERFEGGLWVRIYSGAGPSHALADKAAGTYDYRMRACNAAGCSSWSALSTVEVVYPPATPTLNVPAQGLSGDYTVSWTSVAAADGYELQESDDAGGTWTEVHDGTAVSKAFVDQVAGTYAYQVRACNVAGCSAWSASKSVQVIYAPTGTPTLTVPLQDADGDYTISWSSVAGATEYEVEEFYQFDDTWRPLVRVTGTSKSFTNKLEGSYQYKVRACNDAGCGGTSAIKTVVVEYADPAPATPVLTVPTYGFGGDYTVSWTAETYATRYELLEGSVEVYDGASLSKAWTARAAGTYTYKVRACNVDNLCSAWSASDSVQVIHVPPPCAITAPTTSTTGDYTVSWCAVASADKYELFESVNGGAWMEVQDGTATSRSFVDKPNGSYGYRMRSCNLAGCGAYSGTVTVVVDLPDPTPAVPVLTVPANGYNGNYTVSWTAETYATRYELLEGSVEVYDGPSLSKAWAGRAAGTYTYKVRACNVDNLCSAWSASDSVQVIHAPGPCAITAPATSMTGDYTVSWCAVTGASRYELFESVNDGAWTKIQDSTATSRPFTDRPIGKYEYRMRACNVAGCGAYSAIDTVTVRAPDPSVLTVPTYGLSGDFTVTWTSETGATGYTLEKSGNGGSTWATAYSGTALSLAYVDEPAGTYHFRVRACSDVGCSAWSAIDSVQVVYKPASAPGITVPTQGLSGDYTVSWTSVATATRYELQESANGGTWTEVYDGAAATKTFADRAAGTYAYQVRACNVAGCSAFSASDSVQVIYPPGSAPVLTVPATDDDGDYTISWTAVSGATSYRVQELYELDDTWLTSPATSATSKAYTDKLEGSYDYKVYACNAAGCGPTSAIKTLTVLPPPPPPGTPTGLYVEKLLFTNCAISWNAVANATSYQVQNSSGIRYSGSSTSYRETGCSGSYQVRACNASSCSAWSAGVYPRDPQ